MKKILLYFFSLSIVLLISQSCNETLVDDTSLDELELKSASTAKQGYIVVLNDRELNSELEKLKGYEKKQNAVKAKSAKILKRAGITDGDIEHVYGTALKGFSVKIPPGQLKKLENDVSVKYIEKDQIITLINPYKKPGNRPGGGGGNNQPAEVTPWGVTRVGNGDGTNKTAWVIDSGIDLDHPDLNVNSGLDKSFLSGKQSTNPDDQNGHGTHVAGTIAAIDNAIGVVGVAAGATVVSVRVLDRRGSGSTSGVIAGVNYVASKAKSGDVANMSLGGGFYQALNDAVETAAQNGIKFSLAAGNESTQASSKSPASANGPNIYTISAMNSNDQWASYSNYGTPPVDFCAPGSGILSSWKDGEYKTISGTSMAAPHVAGLLLLNWNGNSDGNVLGDPQLDHNQKGDPIAHL